MPTVKPPNEFWESGMQPSVKKWKQWRTPFEHYVKLYMVLNPAVKDGFSPEIQLMQMSTVLGACGMKYFEWNFIPSHLVLSVKQSTTLQ